MRPNHPPGPQPPAIARCLNGSAFLGGSASLGPVDTLQSRSTQSTQMDELEKSHEETKIFLPADAYLDSTRHVRGQDYLPHPKLIVVWSIQVYAIVLEFGPSESSDLLIGTPVCRAGDLKGDRMKAIALSGLEGFKSLRVADVEKPKPAANQILGTAFHPLILEPRPATMGRILVIEDDGALRKILRRLFSSEGYEVDVVPDAVCGLE